jgi:hypothetical protein
LLFAVCGARAGLYGALGPALVHVLPGSGNVVLESARMDHGSRCGRKPPLPPAATLLDAALARGIAGGRQRGSKV